MTIIPPLPRAGFSYSRLLKKHKPGSDNCGTGRAKARIAAGRASPSRRGGTAWLCSVHLGLLEHLWAELELGWAGLGMQTDPD